MDNVSDNLSGSSEGSVTGALASGMTAGEYFQRLSTLNRGMRLDESEEGYGIGLSIVQEITELYGGSIRLGESKQMGGLQVTVESYPESVFQFLTLCLSHPFR